jgi:hypothetical protein
VTKLHDEFTLALTVHEASSACRRAIAAIGWNVKELGPDRMVPKIAVGLTRNPSKIEVTLSEVEHQTVVRLNGSILGIGPLQRGHLNTEMTRLRGEIEAAARDERGL